MFNIPIQDIKYNAFLSLLLHVIICVQRFSISGYNLDRLSSKNFRDQKSSNSMYTYTYTSGLKTSHDKSLSESNYSDATFPNIQILRVLYIQALQMLPALLVKTVFMLMAVLVSHNLDQALDIDSPSNAVQLHIYDILKFFYPFRDL